MALLEWERSQLLCNFYLMHSKIAMNSWGIQGEVLISGVYGLLYTELLL